MPSGRFQAILSLKTLSFLLLALILGPVNLFGAPQVNQQGRGQAGKQEDGLGWRTVRPSGARASIEMPRRPRYVERSFTPVVGRDPIKVRLHLSTSRDGKASFIFSYHDLAEKPTGKAIDETLEGAVRGTLATVLGKLESQGPLKYKKYQGRQFLYSFRQIDREDKAYDFVALSRVYLVNRRQYQLSVVMDYDAYDLNAEQAKRFLDSFQLIDSPPDLPPVPRNKR